MQKTRKSVLSLMLAIVIIVGMGASIALANPIGGPPAGDVSLTIHHLILPDGTITEGTVTGTPPNLSGTPLTPVADAVWTVQRITADGTWNGAADTVTTAMLGTAVTATTGTNGQAHFNNAALGGQGVFLVSGPADANIAHFAPFIVHLPLLLPGADPEDNNEWIFNVHAFPKEAGAPTFTKHLLGADDAPIHQVGTTPVGGHGAILATWEFRVSINAGLSAITSMRIEDQLDSRFTLVPDSVSISFNDGPAATDVATLPQTGNWTASVNGTNLLTVTFTEDGIGEIADEGEVGGFITVRFQTTTPNNDATVALGDIPNSGNLFYGSRPVIEVSNPVAERQLRVNGLRILKVNNRGTTLAGAEFQLFLPSQMTGVSGDTNRRPVSGAVPLATLTTGADGLVTFRPLLSGTFYLYESVAPTGYVRIRNAMPITIADNLADPFIFEQSVLNTSEFDLPMTGGAGTLIFTAVGLVLIGGSIFFFFVAFKKKNRAR